MRSKISRLPFAIREQVNVRLNDGQEGREILAWLNALPEVTEKITPQNLSVWRTSGFEAWQKDQKSVQEIGLLADTARRMSGADGGEVVRGAGAIMAGQMLSVLQSIRGLDLGDEESIAQFQVMVESVTKLQKALAQDRRVNVAEETLKQRERQLDQRERELTLNEEKFRTWAAEKVMEAAKSPEIQAILGNNNLNHQEQLKGLVQYMFGDQIPDFSKNG